MYMSIESGPHPPAEEIEQSLSPEEIEKNARIQEEFLALPDWFLVYWDRKVENKKGEMKVETKEEDYLEFMKSVNPRFLTVLKTLTVSYMDNKRATDPIEFFKNQYTLPLSDEEAIDAFIIMKNENKEDIEKKIKSWRYYAADLGLPPDTPLVSLTRAGFTLKETAPKAGPTYDNFVDIQDVPFQNDIPTKDALVFFAPRIAPETTRRTAGEQQEQLQKIKEQYKFPENHLVSFGETSTLAALILAHYKRTEQNRNPERIPLDLDFARTDAHHADGSRLCLGHFDSRGLDCDWDFGEDGFIGIGVFALGVEEL